MSQLISTDFGALASALPLASLVRLAAKGALLLGAGLLAMTLMRRRSAAARHLVCATGLGAALLVPAIDAAAPGWSLPLPAALANIIAPANGGRDVAVVAPPVGSVENAPVAADAPANVAPEIASASASSSAAASASSEGVGPSASAVESASAEATPSPASAIEYPRPAVAAVASVNVGERAPWAPAAPLVAIWLLGAIIVFSPIAISHLRLRRLAARSLWPEDATWNVLVAEVSEELGLERVVELRESDEVAMPMTFGIRHPVVVVPSSADTWSDARRLHVLRHELAHIERHDCLTQLIAQIACAVHWFDPLAWIAARRLREEREHACDDRVLDAGSRASDYAECLLDVARDAKSPQTGAIAALAMARRSKLSDRLFALLDEHRERTRVSRGAALRIGALGAAAALAIGAAAPTPARGAAVPVRAAIDEWNLPARAARPSADRHVVSTTLAPTHAPASAPVVVGAVGSGPSTSPTAMVPPASRPRAVVVSPPPCPATGTRSAAHSNSSNMSTENGDGSHRKVSVMLSTGDCKIEFEAYGIVKFAPDLTDVTSVSDGGSFWIEQRIGDDTKRVTIRNRGGSLERAYLVNGEKRAYDDDARRWIGEMLIALEKRTAFAADEHVPYLMEHGGVEAVLQWADQMESSYARRRYYSPMLASGKLDAGQVKHVLEQAARTIDSDYEMSELLIAAAKTNAFDSRSHPAFVAAVKTINSDYERRRAITALLDRDTVGKEALQGLLQAAATTKSDYELAELLIAISKRYAIDESTRPIYIEALGHLKSDYEHRRVLNVVAKAGRQTPAVTRALLVDVKRIKGAYELTEAILTLEDEGALDASNQRELFAAIDAIGQDYEKHRALTGVLKHGKLSRDLAREVLRSARGIAGDYECATLLTEVAGAITIDGDLRDDYEAAAKTIKGEYEYGRAMAAIRDRTSR